MKGTLIKELYALKSSRMIALIIVYAVVILLSILVSTPWFSLILFVLCVWRHRANIGRLIKGTENKLGQKAK